MINLKTKNRIFISFPQRNWEIMETYSVTFHNFRFPGWERDENAKKWLHREHGQSNGDKILSQIISVPCMIFSNQHSHTPDNGIHRHEQLAAASPRIMIVAGKIFSVTALKFFYTLSAPLCLTRENARQGTARRGF